MALDKIASITVLRMKMYSNCKLHSRCPATLFESWGAADPKVAQDHLVGVTTYEKPHQLYSVMDLVSTILEVKLMVF